MNRFRLLNQRKQHIATILFFFEESIQQNVGIIISAEDMTINSSWLFENEPIDEVVKMLANRIDIIFETYLELK